MSYSVLILEDNLRVVRKILRGFSRSGLDIMPTLVSGPDLVRPLINPNLDRFDLILLDYNGPGSQSFHQLDFSRFDPNRIIAISSLPYHNRNFPHAVTKNYHRLNDFVDELVLMVRSILEPSASNGPA